MTLYVTNSNGYTFDFQNVECWDILNGGLVGIRFKNGDFKLLSPYSFSEISIKKENNNE